MTAPTIQDLTVVLGVAKKDIAEAKEKFASACRSETVYFYERSKHDLRINRAFLYLELQGEAREGVLRRVFHYTDHLRCEQEMRDTAAKLLKDAKDDGVVKKLGDLISLQVKRTRKERDVVLPNFVKRPKTHFKS